MKSLASILLCILCAATAHAQATFDLAAGTGTGAGWTWEDPVLTVNNGANITITGQVSNGRRI